MCVISEVRRGLKCTFTFKCKMCNIKMKVDSESSNEKFMDVNSAAVAGSIASGAGYTQLSEQLAAMNVPSMSHTTFIKYQDGVLDGFEKTSLEEMKEAAKDEARLAVQRGDVDRNGIPILTVVCDGSWPKRSFRNNYSSLSGVVSLHFLVPL